MQNGKVGQRLQTQTQIVPLWLCLRGSEQGSADIRIQVRCPVYASCESASSSSLSAAHRVLCQGSRRHVTEHHVWPNRMGLNAAGDDLAAEVSHEINEMGCLQCATFFREPLKYPAAAPTA